MRSGVTEVLSTTPVYFGGSNRVNSALSKEDDFLGAAASESDQSMFAILPYEFTDRPWRKLIRDQYIQPSVIGQSGNQRASKYPTPIGVRAKLTEFSGYVRPAFYRSRAEGGAVPANGFAETNQFVQIRCQA